MTDNYHFWGEEPQLTSFPRGTVADNYDFWGGGGGGGITLDKPHLRNHSVPESRPHTEGFQTEMIPRSKKMTCIKIPNIFTMDAA